MANNSINILLDKMKSIYGESGIQPYGAGPREGHGIAFRIKGIPATFSALTLDGALPEGRYDIQIESYPPGEYVYTNEVNLSEFISIVERICGPESDWP